MNKFGNIWGSCALAGGVALAICQWFIFVYAPEEAVMGLVQKIFYIHLPLAWWALISFFVVFVASVQYLRTRGRDWDALAAASAEVGVVLSALALVSGSVWARQSWGVWWNWDPRLTTTLIMWFIYSAYLILRRLELPVERRSMIAAVVGIIAFIDVPLVFLSARMWRSQHPNVFAAKGGGLDPAMRLTVIFCVLAFGLFWLGLTGLRCRNLKLKSRLDDLARIETDIL